MTGQPAMESRSAGTHSRGAFVHLDLLRGAAALAVCLGHARNLFLVDGGQRDVANPLSDAFYFATSLGHEAVLLFFVLSGFWIVRSIDQSMQAGSWAWREYAVARLTRLYIVLLPALALTAAIDAVGMGLFGQPASYLGATGSNVVPAPVSERTTWEVYVGTAVFVQEILVGTPGTNSPLWSLSYEFWYYLAFPFLYLAIAPRSDWRWRLVCLAVVAAIGAFVGPAIIFRFPIWLMGGAVALLARRSGYRLTGIRQAVLLSCAIVAALALILADTRFGIALPAQEQILGLSFAIAIAALVFGPRRGPFTSFAGRFYQTLAETVAGFSYTLYAVHLPVLVFLQAVLLPDGRAQPDATGLSLWFIAVMMAVAVAFGVAAVTERHTDTLRRWILRKLPSGTVTAQANLPRPSS